MITPCRTEIVTPVDLCTPDGQLNPAAVGWSRHPLHRGNLRGRFGRKKRWDYWCVLGERFLFSATIAHIDYLALGAIYFLEYDTRRFARAEAAHLFPSKPNMPKTVGGDIAFQHRNLSIRFESAGDSVHMTASCPSFAGKPLEADLLVHRPADHETLNVVVPWNPRTFQFTSKQHCLPTEGALQWGGESLPFARPSSFAFLDYGRGIWPIQTTWNWAAFGSTQQEGVVGINMGAQWTDGTGANENGIFVNGTMHKLFEDIAFTYDRNHFMAPWRMKTQESDAVDLEFTPFYDNITSANLIILRANGHQLFGRYSGTVRAGGQTIPIQNVLGWAEEHRARW